MSKHTQLDRIVALERSLNAFQARQQKESGAIVNDAENMADRLKRLQAKVEDNQDRLDALKVSVKNDNGNEKLDVEAFEHDRGAMARFLVNKASNEDHAKIRSWGNDVPVTPPKATEEPNQNAPVAR